VHNARARQDTFFFKTKSHTAYPDFQTDVRGSEATLPRPGVRSAFQDALYPFGLIHPHCSLITNHYNIMFYTRINKIKIFNNCEGYWQMTLNRTEYYPHGVRDRQDTADTTGNILVDYTLFGFENEVENKGLLITTDKV
jgi:hypothetical protein